MKHEYSAQSENHLQLTSSSQTAGSRDANQEFLLPPAHPCLVLSDLSDFSHSQGWETISL